MNLARRSEHAPAAVRRIASRRIHGSQPWTDPVSAAEYLASLGGYEVYGAIRGPSTRRIEAITRVLGSPNHRFPSIHVTGTNGKGSTSAMATKLLRGQGLRVGTYTSPHLSDVTERIAIDEKPVSGERFAEALGTVASMSRRIGVTPSWFEAVTASAFVLFADAEVDAAVVEVGMLGRWDATNILNSTVAVVTNVELDHTEFAGHTRMQVAMEKAGIVHPATTLVLGETDSKLVPIFAAQRPRRLLQLDVDISVTGRQRSRTGSTVDLATPWGLHRTVPVNLLGAHQCRNAALALAAVEGFLESPIDSQAVRHALSTVQIGGRAEVLPETAPVIVVDGAHNEAAARALRVTLDEYFFAANRRVLVCAASGNRRPTEFLSGIGADDFDLVIATQAPSPRSVPPEAITAAARRSGVAAMASPDVAIALRSAVTSAGVGGLVVVAGSLYLVAAAREAAADLGITPGEEVGARES